MAQFSMGIGSNEKVEAYLYRLTQQLEYMFSHLSPEDNFDENARLIYVTNGERQTAMELSLEGISLSMVDKDNVVSAINLSKEGVKIQGDKITLEGVITANSDFRITLDGSMEARNGTFQGDISASNITGSTVTGGTITAGGTDDSSITVNDKDGNPVAILNKLGVDVRAGSIKGANVEVGGTGNTNGTLIVRNASGAAVVTLNNEGIKIINGALSVTGGGSITGSTITGGTINGSNINVGGNGVGGQILIKDASGNTLCTLAPGGIRFDGGTIAGGTITGGTISGTAISGGTITGGAISGGTITGGAISGGSVTGTTISGGSITGTTISGGSITGTTISGGTITGGAISGGTITGGAISGGTITGTAVSGGSLTGATVSGNTISGGTLSVGQFYTDATETRIGDFCCSIDYGRQMFCSEGMVTGMSAEPMTQGGYYFWAGWDEDTEDCLFAVNNGGQVWAHDVGIWDYGVTLRDILGELDDEGCGTLWEFVEAVIDSYGGPT